jgi:hypothetical protein
LDKLLFGLSNGHIMHPYPASQPLPTLRWHISHNLSQLGRPQAVTYQSTSRLNHVLWPNHIPHFH